MFEGKSFTERFIEREIAVFIISQKGMAYAGEVPADLVHTACPKFKFQEGIADVTNFPVGKDTVKRLGFLHGFCLAFPPRVKTEPYYSLFRFGDARTNAKILFDN